MIELGETILRRRRGMLARVESNASFIPEISPDIQGREAYNLLTVEQKAQLAVALKDASKLKKCPIIDLEWSFGRGSPIQPIRIRKRQRIEI